MAEPDTTARKPKITILGGGKMGVSIAYLFARSRHPVTVFEPVEAARQALHGRLHAVALMLGDEGEFARTIHADADLEQSAAGAQLIIEAVPEKVALKQQLFAELDRITPTTTILASNTSAIPIRTISRDVVNKHRVVGTHFWLPAHIMELVEVVQMEEENLSAVLSTIELLKAVGWTPVHVRRDIPGFIGNRLQHALKREAIALVASGVCDAETVDLVTKLGFGRRLGVIGPLEQSDLAGLTGTLDIHRVLIADLDATRGPAPLLEELVSKGHTGCAVGKGFRSWTPGQVKALTERIDEFMTAQAQQGGVRLPQPGEETL